MNNIILYNGDCLELMKNISDNSVDCIICDLPYGTTKLDWLHIYNIDCEELVFGGKNV